MSVASGHDRGRVISLSAVPDYTVSGGGGWRGQSGGEEGGCSGGAGSWSSQCGGDGRQHACFSTTLEPPTQVQWNTTKSTESQMSGSCSGVSHGDLMWDRVMLAQQMWLYV